MFKFFIHGNNKRENILKDLKVVDFIKERT